MIAPPFDGNTLIRGFLASHGEPRGDELLLHMSDVNACDYATKLRIEGAPVMSKDAASRAAFAMGHAVEAYVVAMFEPLRADGWTITKGREVDYRGVVGHIDYDIERDGARFVIDVTTTKSKSTDYKMGHALKSAGYALAIDASMFAEVVLSLGFGVINAAEWHWFSTADYAPKIEAAIDRLHALKSSDGLPLMEPPKGEEWRCRAYCDAFCQRNDKLAPRGDSDLTAIDAEYQDSTAIAVREEMTPAAPAMFGTTDPVEIVERAVRVADALKKVVVAKKLVAVIQGKEYPMVEAWQTMGAMLGLTAITEWSRRVEGGWEARAYVVNSVGRTIGSAESQCLKSERGKGGWEDYAIRSMAQTRAVSKSFRSVLAFVMVLAGYQATPAEEMPSNAPAPSTAEVVSPTDLRVARARELGLIPAGELKQGLIDLKNYLHGFGVAWGLRSIDAHFEEVVAARAEAAPEIKYAVKKPTAAQKKMYFALCGELQMDDDQRHAFNKIVIDKNSFSEFTFEEAHRAIDELNGRLDTQNAGGMIHPYARPPRPPLEPIEDVEQTHLEGLSQFICFAALLAFVILLASALVRYLHGG